MEDLGRKNARLFQDIARSFREVLEISVNLHPLSSHSVNFLVANWEHPGRLTSLKVKPIITY